MPRPALFMLAAVLALGPAVPAHAIGQLVDVQVVDRGTGETLSPIFHSGEWWIAGRPGARYGVTLLSRNPQRTLNVVSVDGVNAISGDSAGWNQTGYVLDGYQRTQIDGWRKNMNQVAAFEFTALPDSYAARTGRPANVGVIGIAIFNEKPKVFPPARPDIGPAETRRMAPSAASTDTSNSDAAPSQAPARAESEKSSGLLSQRDRIGTGHGDIEESSIRYTAFQRARSAPDEIVTIRYDRIENLIAMGIVPTPPIASLPTPNPFPGSGRFVADPPPRR